MVKNLQYLQTFGVNNFSFKYSEETHIMLRGPKMLEGFELELLNTKTLETAALCDSHWGEGLYPVSSLRTIVGDSRHTFHS